MGCVRACMKPMLPPPPAGAPGAFFSTGSRPTSEGSFGRNMKLATPVMPLSTPGEGEGEGAREGGSAGEGWGENEGEGESEGQGEGEDRRVDAYRAGAGRTASGSRR